METFNNILVVSRSTRNCVKVLRKGISLARKYGAKLHILHVIYDPFYFNDWNISLSAFEDELQAAMAKARRELDELIRVEKSEGLEITEQVEHGKPVDEILKVVESKNIDLIIMLAHKEGRFEHFLFGRTNEAIIRELPASLMLVH
jgi:nucleotide-binding universal stress UspA family protein